MNAKFTAQICELEKAGVDIFDLDSVADEALDAGFEDLGIFILNFPSTYQNLVSGWFWDDEDDEEF